MGEMLFAVTLSINSPHSNNLKPAKEEMPFVFSPIMLFRMSQLYLINA
jgi:hypothetical protein